MVFRDNRGAIQSASKVGLRSRTTYVNVKVTFMRKNLLERLIDLELKRIVRPLVETFVV